MPAIKPSLNLEFVKTQQLDPRITFTRASTATRINKLGKLEVVPANQPRFDFDPVTLQCKGLLIEEQRTNFFRNSNDFSNATWQKTDTTVTATQNQFGLMLLREGVVGTAQVRSDVFGLTANGIHSSTLYVARGNCDWIQIIQNDGGGGEAKNAWFNLTTGVFGTVSTAPGTFHSHSVNYVGGGVYAVTIAFIPNATATGRGMIVRSASGNGSTTRVNGAEYFAGMAQLELGSFPTSYIPTTASAVTRAADIASVNNVTPWCKQGEGTLYAEGSIYVFVNTQRGMAQLEGISPLTDNIRVGHQNGAVKYMSMVTGGVSQLEPESVTAVQGVSHKCVMAYATNNSQHAINGAVKAVDSSCSIPTISRLLLGTGGGALLLKKVTYYPSRLTASELQSLTF